MTENELIEACLKQNPAAQRELYNRYSPKMLSLCYRYAHNREDAEDMLQEGFIKVFSHISSFENKGSFEGWIRRIIVTTCLNFLTREKKFFDSESLEAAQEPAIQSPVFALMQARQVVECIRQLPDGYRAVLNLFAIEGYSHREIADLMGIEESTSRSQYTRARYLLEEMLVRNNILTKTKKQTGVVTAFNRP